MTSRTARLRLSLASLVAAAALLAGTASFAAEPAAAADEAKELELLRSMVSQARSPVKAEDRVVPIGNHPLLGEPGALLTLIEFSDLQCGFCRRHLNSTLPVLVERYVGTGRMRYVFFDFPVTERHPEAFGAAVAARCAAEQNAVQPMRERFYANPTQLARDQLVGHAAAIGLDTAAFARCLYDEAKAEAVRQDLALGQSMGVRGTPTFLIGYSQGDGTTVRVLRRIVGAQPLDAFETALNGVLAEAQGSMAATE